MTQLFRAGMIGAAKRLQAGTLGTAATVFRRTLQGEVGAGATLPRPAPAGLFDGMMFDVQRAFDDLQSFNPFAPASAAAQPRAAQARGTFEELRHAGPAGARSYKLYVPACAEAGAAMPLVVMLHGCTQSPDDFALGTRMNEWAERDGFLVCYPAQTSAANGQRCWNWFKAADQRRGAGEPAIVAGITRDVMARRPVDPARVYVAGLSAGGALAATMGQTYPDLYAAIGVHSGLACGAAHDVNSAFAAMRQGGGPRAGGEASRIPAIVFHGDRDGTVSPANADEVAAQALDAAAVRVEVEEGTAEGGHRFRRARHLDGAGRALVELWSVRGGAHAWSGGSPAGSYTDPQGPDASGEMLRFFAEHVGPASDGLPRTA